MSYFTTFQFIYQFFPRPNENIILLIQVAIIVSCIFGILGVHPKACALIAFLFSTHLTGMVQITNAEIDGGTIALCSLLILALSPRESFYGLANGYSLTQRNSRYHWPIFLLFFVIGSFYTSAGINKIIDIGIHWPFVLHLDHLAEVGIENSIFLSSRYVSPSVSSFHLSYPLSVIAGVVALIGELFFVTIVFLPRYRLFFVASMSLMHCLVFLTAGINFVGSSILLFLCLDWNSLLRRVTIYYDDQCLFCSRTVFGLKKLDWFHRLETVPISDDVPHSLDMRRLELEMGLKDENGEVYYGADAFEQVASRLPVLYPLAILTKIPGIIFVSRYLYLLIAENRYRFSCHVNDSCKLK
ncbi:thiol-disulfide oxidoreductase DCC family protein [Halomicronema hongdechloris]|nr:DUF393 domain-containing protein [Halomicronema hongdechloris]